MILSELSIKRPVLAIMMNLGIVLFGIVGLSRLAVRELPDIDPPIINVSTIYPGASAEVVETQVSEIIEESLTSIEGIKTLSSESREQFSNITIKFDLTRDVDIAAQDVRDRVSRVRGRLPEEIDEPIIAKQDADASPALWIALYSDRYSTLELTTLAENTMKDRLQTVKGVSSVILGGSKRFAIRLWLDPEKMAARGVTVIDVDSALKAQNVELPSGRVENLQRELSIETAGQMKTPEQYNDLVIKKQGANFIRLKDIGRAEIGVEDQRSAARFNTQPAVGLGIVKQSKANTIEVARAVKAELERIKTTLPEGVSTSIPYDESVYVQKSIHEVWETLAISFFLVVLAIFIFLHNVRSTLIPAVTIPVSLIGTFAVLYVFGFSINIVTMLGLVLAIGLVVDDAIIVLENIHRHIEEGHKPMQAAFLGMKEIGFAVIATTVALVAVFLPMAFQTSDTGRMFIEFAVAISFSVMISSFVALTLSPMMCSRVLKPVEKHGRPGFFDHFENFLGRITRGYGRMLVWALNHPVWILLGAGVALAGAVFFFTQLERDFLPTEDKGRLLCIVITPEGSTSEYTDRMVRKMEDIIKAQPEVEGFFSAVALARGGPGKSNEGLAFLRLKDKRERSVGDMIGGPAGLGMQFFTTIEGALVIPIIPKAIGRGFSQPFQLVLQNQDLDALNEYTLKLSDRLRASGTLMNVRSTFELNRPQLRVSIDRDRAAALGVSVRDIARTLQVLFGGLDLSKLNLYGKQYDVIVELPRESRLTPSDLDRLYVSGSEGRLVQLNNLVTYTTGGGPSVINHYNRYRSATIEATPAGIPMGAAMEQAETIMKNDLPDGFKYEWDGEAKDLRESGGELLFVMILAILVIYMVLASQFESFVHPFTILLTVPLAFFGALGALYVLNIVNGLAIMTTMIPGHPLKGWIPKIPSMGINLFSQIGMILLMGLVTKNAILLVDFANQRVAQGMDPRNAMLEAGRVRLRPILMTAVATIVGILPIAIGFGAGAESRRPLGVAAEGGMLTSTFLTLFVVPVVYVLLSRRKKRGAGGIVVNGAHAEEVSKKEKSVNPRFKQTLCLLIAGTFAFSGCNLAPKYHRPEMAMPGQWKAPQDSEFWKVAEPQDHLSRGDWWTIFNDQELNRLESMAVDQNQNLKSAMASVQQARALARIASKVGAPLLSIDPAAQRVWESQGGSYFSTADTNDTFSLPLDLSYESDFWDFWGRNRSISEAGWAQASAEQSAYQTVLLTLTADVAYNYFQLRTVDKEISILEETIKLRQDAVDLVSHRVQAGIGKELDLNRARTELARAQTDHVDAMRRRAELENALAVLCGRMAADFSLASGFLEDFVPMVPVGLPSTLLERRPDVAQEERLVQAANAAIGTARAAFYPRIALNSSVKLENSKLGNLFKSTSLAWSLGPSVRWDVFDFGRNGSNLEAAKAAYEATVADYRQSVLQAFADVETYLSNVRLRQRQADAQRHVVEAARITADISTARYKEGLVNFLEVVDAERSRLDAELEAARILSQRLIASVQLVKALGGGWQQQE